MNAAVYCQPVANPSVMVADRDESECLARRLEFCRLTQPYPKILLHPPIRWLNRTKVLNEPLAAELGLDVDWLKSPAGLQVLW